MVKCSVRCTPRILNKCSNSNNHTKKTTTLLPSQKPTTAVSSPSQTHFKGLRARSNAINQTMSWKYTYSYSYKKQCNDWIWIGTDFPFWLTSSSRIKPWAIEFYKIRQLKWILANYFLPMTLEKHPDFQTEVISNSINRFILKHCSTFEIGEVDVN